MSNHVVRILKKLTSNRWHRLLLAILGITFTLDALLLLTSYITVYYAHHKAQKIMGEVRTLERRVSTTLRQVLTEFSEFFHVSGTGLLIQTSLGRAGGFGALRTKRSG